MAVDGADPFMHPSRGHTPTRESPTVVPSIRQMRAESPLQECSRWRCNYLAFAAIATTAGAFVLASQKDNQAFAGGCFTVSLGSVLYATMDKCKKAWHKFRTPISTPELGPQNGNIDALPRPDLELGRQLIETGARGAS